MIDPVLSLHMCKAAVNVAMSDGIDAATQTMSARCTAVRHSRWKCAATQLPGNQLLVCKASQQLDLAEPALSAEQQHLQAATLCSDSTIWQAAAST